MSTNIASGDELGVPRPEQRAPCIERTALAVPHGLEPLDRAVQAILGRPAVQIASPGTYDHKHVTRIGGVVSCVAYGPGVLEQAHQPDEWCRIEDMVNSAKVMALALLRLVGTA